MDLVAPGRDRRSRLTSTRRRSGGPPSASGRGNAGSATVKGLAWSLTRTLRDSRWACLSSASEARTEWRDRIAGSRPGRPWTATARGWGCRRTRPEERPPGGQLRQVLRIPRPGWNPRVLPRPVSGARWEPRRRRLEDWCDSRERPGASWHHRRPTRDPPAARAVPRPHRLLARPRDRPGPPERRVLKAGPRPRSACPGHARRTTDGAPAEGRLHRQATRSTFPPARPRALSARSLPRSGGPARGSLAGARAAKDGTARRCRDHPDRIARSSHQGLDCSSPRIYRRLMVSCRIRR